MDDADFLRPEAGKAPVLTTAMRDRAVGAVIGMATGDALGAGYESGMRVSAQDVRMLGGGLGDFAPGEWTDDTSMAIPLLEAIAAGKDMLDPATQDEVVQRWVQWRARATDVGITIASVLARVRVDDAAASLRHAASEMFARGIPSAGNGSLMRTTPLALGFLPDAQGLAQAARTYSDLTHGDPDAADACVLYNLAQRHAILTGELELLIGLEHLPEDRRLRWEQRIQEAAIAPRGAFVSRNGWVVAALQSAWQVIQSLPADGPEHLEQSLRAVVADGGDTDTVAAIAGGLLGARWGVSAVPLGWRRQLHGWPHLSGQQLAQMAEVALSRRAQEQYLYAQRLPGAPPVQHPHDPGVWIGDVFGLQDLPTGVDAVISLCRLGRAEGPPPGRVLPENHLNVWLIDSAQDSQNPHIDFVTAQTVALLAQLRSEGREVYLHCVEARSRTPYIAAMYGAWVSNLSGEQALADVARVLPQTSPNSAFRDRLRAVQP